MTNRRKSWNNDLFVKSMVSLAVILIGASYDTLTTYILEETKFRGEISQFKKDAIADIKENKSNIAMIDGKQIIENKNNIKRIDKKQIGRTENVAYSGLLKLGDKETIERLCKQIIKDTCP